MLKIFDEFWGCWTVREDALEKGTGVLKEALREDEVEEEEEEENDEYEVLVKGVGVFGGILENEEADVESEEGKTLTDPSEGRGRETTFGT